jgi:hypothetical protein
MRNSKHIEENSEVYLVTWKKQNGRIELFYDLEVFAASYPRYNLPEISSALASGIAVFEDEDIRIERKVVTTIPKPDLPPMFFWDFKYDRIDWAGSPGTIIQRILERGMPEHWQELKRFYGLETITTALKELITYLPDECIDEASLYFNIKKEEMLCYKRKQSQPKLWL